MKKLLADDETKHSLCEDLVVSLRNQITALEISRGYAKVCVLPCFLASILPCTLSDVNTTNRMK